MEKFAIILAGGEGKRAGGNLPKQFRDLRGRPIVWWSMMKFHEENPDTHIILVLHPGFFDDWDIMYSQLEDKDLIPHTVCCGGADRMASVYNGLLMIEEIVNNEKSEGSDFKVAIHDGARPMVTEAIIRKGWEIASEGTCAVPVVPVVGSLRRLTGTDEIDGMLRSEVVDRTEYREVQTPQTFIFKDILDCYKKRGDKIFTDDASLAQESGVNVKLFEGSTINIKITNPSDFLIAEVLSCE